MIRQEETFTALTIVRIIAMVLVVYVFIGAYVSLFKGEVHEGLQRLADTAFGAAAALLSPSAVRGKEVKEEDGPSK